MFLHGWFFISYQTQIFACDPSRINWTATGAFPGGFADDDDDYSAEGFFHQSCATGTLLLRKKIYPRKYSLNCIFMFLHGWIFISYQTRRLAGEP